jgi:heme/copper-type cytochrome/quinol oxidase subunit 4
MMLLLAIFLHVIALWLAAAGGFRAGEDRELDFLFWLAAVTLTAIAMGVAQ